MSCPVIPPVPQEVLMRFRTMRDYDLKMRRYGTDLCAAIPEAFDPTDILERLATVEALLASHSSRLSEVESSVESLASGTSKITWIIVSTTPYTITDHNVGLRVVTTTLAITVNLPKASYYKGESIYIKDDSGNAGENNITVNPDGTDTIDDDATLVVDANYAGIELKSNGVGWEIV